MATKKHITVGADDHGDTIYKNNKSINIDSINIDLLKLDTVKQLEKMYNQHLSSIIRQKPSNNFNYYWIQIGVNNNIRFEPLLNFQIDCKTAKIFFYDVINDERILIPRR